MSNGINIHQLFCKDFNKITSEYRTTIMGIAMLSVMLFHQYFTSVFPFNVFHNFGNWGVDVFLFLSGMGLVRSLERNSLPIYYKRRFKRIIPSCIICGTTKYVIILLLGPSVAALVDGLNLGWWSLASLDSWFIPTILILYTISPLLNNLLRKWPYISLTIITITMLVNGLTLRPVIGNEWTSPLGILSWTIERLPVFSAGMFLSIRKDWIDDKISYSILFLIAALGFRILDKYGFFLHARTYSFIALTFGMPTLILANIYFLRFLPIIIKKGFVFLGEYSLELYLVHGFIFWSLKINHVNVSSWLLLPIAITLSLLAAYFSKYIVKKFCHE